MRIAGELCPAVLLRRLNRFAALVHMGGRPQAVHLPNSGRLHELLTPGRPALVALPGPQAAGGREAGAPQAAADPARGRGRRTAGDLVFMLGPQGWVSVDARLPGRLLQEAVAQGRVDGLAGWSVARLEYRPPHAPGSRLDLLLEGPAGPVAVETKSVTLVVEGAALFPDAPTLRGQRHLRVLAELARQGSGAWVVFVVQRPDARYFTPHRQADPAFARELELAWRSGVQVRAYACRVRPPHVEVERPIPVRLGPEAEGGEAAGP